jgi:hypothetical protein
MVERTKLEIEFEIVILKNNIENNKIMGIRSTDLQRRLDACLVQLEALKSDEGATEIKSNVKA